MTGQLFVKKENILFFSSIVILLQSFRSYIIYLIFLILVISLLFYSFLKDNQIFNSNRSTQLFYWLFLIFLMFTTIISFFYSPINDVITGSVRMWFMPLLVVLFYGLISKEKDFHTLIKAYLLIIFLASASIFLQIFFGTTIFGESYLRSGLQRYSSILGSVTIFGQVIGVAIFLSIVMPFSKTMKVFLVTIFLSAAAISLSKAAVMNAIVAVLVSVIYFRNLRIIIYFSLLFTIMYFFVTIFNDLAFSKYINAMLFTAFRINILDSYVPLGTPPVTLDQITSRLLGKFDLWNKTALETVFGIGIKGGAGALGVIGVTSHNQYIDIWQMGGLGLLISFVLLQISVIINLVLIKSSFSKILFYTNGMVILNFIVQNGGLFHPATSFFFWISVIYVIFNKKNQKQLL